jgi:exodeoxyribonuclease VII small subunit
MAEIERITVALERGDLPLDEALEAFERASALARDAQGLLAAANARLTKLVAGPDRRPEEVDLELPTASTAPGLGRA